MNIFKLTTISVLLLTGPLLWAEPTSVVSPPASTDPLAEALPILQAKYPDFATLNYKQGDHLSDLIARSNGEISLDAETISAPFSIVTATLPDNIIYWRLASFTPATSWVDLGTQLEKEGSSATGVILDLRSNADQAGVAEASQVINFFAPGDGSLSKFLPLMADGLKFGGPVIPDHPYHGPIVVLINHQTTGEAEVLAARLKADGALVVGRETSGKGAVFKEQKLSSGNILRYVAAHVFEADGSDLWGQPVVPDIALKVNDRTEKAALVLIRDKHISDVIEESAERHRLNEASLVKGQDPELDDYLASLEKGPVLLSLPVIHDVALIGALDSLRAIRLSEQPPAEATTTAKASTPATTSSVQ